MDAAPPIAISSGDPAGVAPELIVMAWHLRRERSLPPFFAIGAGHIFESAARAIGLDVGVHLINDPNDTDAVFAHALPVIEPDHAAPLRYTPGSPCNDGALLAMAALEKGVEYAQSGTARALVTGPVSKANLAVCGFAFPGQTEFLAHACGLNADKVVMMLAGPTLRTVPLTIHCALSDVPRLITRERILGCAHIVNEALRRDFGIPNPHIAVAGLNPHCGENGAFGNEDIRIIAPSIAQLRGQGMNISGPFAADSLFAPHERGLYDAAICMYHDQALIPIKALHFDNGVNVTLGLPIIRTSPDHGTAFGIAGQGKARPDAMIAAIHMAADMAEKRAHG